MTIGANAAMMLGMTDKANKFYQTTLKFDPDNNTARTQYRGLKKVIKLLGQAEDQIEKGYFKTAAQHIDECLSAMRGLDVDSPLFRSKVALKLCTVLASMNQAEEALNQCNTAVEVREDDTVSTEMKKEAYLLRAEALLQDFDYDGAITDFRKAAELSEELSNEEETHRLRMRLKEVMHEKKKWDGGEKDHWHNEHTGFPNGKPMERDHIKILGLPINLEEHNKEIKCSWLKKKFKELVRKYHPDKYKGNKMRAARKFKEVTDSKGFLSESWQC